MNCMKHRFARSRPSFFPFFQLAIFVALVLALAAPAFAQEPTPTLDQINVVARELYCPLCNGVRLDSCELQACIQMRQVIANRLMAGASKEQIKSEFVAQYGPVVLGEPPRQGLDLLAWIVPIALLVGGGIWLLYTARRWTRQPAPAATPVGDAAATPIAPSAPPAAAVDDYLARIEADLDSEEL